MGRETDLLRLALLILHDGCPPDNRMYLCRMGEEPEADCRLCWEHYLFWAANGYDGDPYRFDRQKNC